MRGELKGTFAQFYLIASFGFSLDTPGVARPVRRSRCPIADRKQGGRPTLQTMSQPTPRRRTVERHAATSASRDEIFAADDDRGAPSERWSFNPREHCACVLCYLGCWRGRGMKPVECTMSSKLSSPAKRRRARGINFRMWRREQISRGAGKRASRDSRSGRPTRHPDSLNVLLIKRPEETLAFAQCRAPEAEQKGHE
jgi:hypothetical protein